LVFPRRSAFKGGLRPSCANTAPGGKNPRLPAGTDSLRVGYFSNLGAPGRRADHPAREKPHSPSRTMELPPNTHRFRNLFYRKNMGFARGRRKFVGLNNGERRFRQKSWRPPAQERSKQSRSGQNA